MAVSRSENGGYEVQCWYKDYLGTRRKKHKRGFRTKAEARRWERDFLLKAEGSPHMLFKDFVDAYEADVRPGLKLSTWLTKEAIIRMKVLPHFGDMYLDEIRSTDIIAWRNALQSPSDLNGGKTYAKSYIRTIENQMSAILNHAVRHYGLRATPFAQAGRTAKEPPVNVDFWTKDEYLRFSDAIMDKPGSFTAFEILYYLGLRMGEMLALTPGDFDFEAKTLRVSRNYQRLQGKDVITDPKTPKSRRVIAVPAFLVEEVEEYIALCGVADDERMFTFSKSFLHHEMRRGCALSGVKVVRIHDLRRSHVSLLIDLGFSALAIAERLGHEAIDVTFRYADLFPGVQEDMARALDALRGGE